MFGYTIEPSNLKLFSIGKEDLRRPTPTSCPQTLHVLVAGEGSCAASFLSVLPRGVLVDPTDANSDARLNAAFTEGSGKHLKAGPNNCTRS